MARIRSVAKAQRILAGACSGDKREARDFLAHRKFVADFIADLVGKVVRSFHREAA